MVLHIKPLSLKLYAKISKALIPIHGICKLSEKAFAVATPILIPVKDPGPISHTSKLISFKDILFFSKRFLIKFSSVSECVNQYLILIYQIKYHFLILLRCIKY